MRNFSDLSLGSIVLKNHMPTPYAHTICPHHMNIHIAYRLVGFLVRVTQGRPPTESNKRGYYPYGVKAAQSSKKFKKVPFTMFAHTLTVIYPFIRFDKNEWVSRKLIKDPNRAKGVKGPQPAAHPLNKGGL